MTPDNGPSNKRGKKRPEAPGIEKKTPGEREQPAAPERTDREPATPTTPANAGPSTEEVIANAAQPVTNQDEQEKITNAGNDDIPVPAK